MRLRSCAQNRTLRSSEQERHGQQWVREEEQALSDRFWLVEAHAAESSVEPAQRAERLAAEYHAAEMGLAEARLGCSPFLSWMSW